MKAVPDPTQSAAPARRDVSLDYLRATVTLLVVVLHCSLPYTYIAKAWQPAAWNAPVPIIDRESVRGLGYIITLLNASRMPLMFFISGLFTYPALRKKGSLQFLKTRFYRLGLPFLGMTLVLMPLAYYAPWSLANPGGSFGRFLLVDAHAGFAAGPGWFLWLLLFFDCVMASLYVVAGGVMPWLIPRLRILSQMPWLCALLLMVAGFAFFIPLTLRYGELWLPVITMPFVLQPGRSMFYAVWLFAGFLAGSTGLDQGLLAEQGRLTRDWRWWLALGLIGGNATWFCNRTGLLLKLAPLERQVILDLLWVVAGVVICFALIALFRAHVRKRRAWADSLARHAYAIYACHYIFALWMERELLRVSAPALVKFSLCCVVTVALSWAAAIGWLRLWKLGLLWVGSAAPPAASGERLGEQGLEGVVRRRA